jgi:hypothetical protein
MAARELGMRDGVERLTVRMPADMHEAVRTVAFATNASINDVVIRAVGDYLTDAGRSQAVDSFLERAQDQWHVALDKLADM